MDNYLEFVYTLDKTRENLRLLYDTKQYIKCIAAYTSFLEFLEQNDINDKEVRYNLWFVYKRLSALYCKFKKHEEAMECARKAMVYQNSEVEYYLTLWLLGLIQETTNRKRAIKYYDKCIFYYGKTKQHNYLKLVAENKNCLIAKVNNNIGLLNFEDDINTFNNTASIIEYIHNNTYNIALNIIDRLVDLTCYRVAYATI